MRLSVSFRICALVLALGSLGVMTARADEVTGTDPTVSPSARQQAFALQIAQADQGGLGLPEREYYFADQFKKQRDAYKAYIVRTMKMLGNAEPEKAADIIMGFESEIAYKSWKIADRRVECGEVERRRRRGIVLEPQQTGTAGAIDDREAKFVNGVLDAVAKDAGR